MRKVVLAAFAFLAFVRVFGKFKSPLQKFFAFRFKIVGDGFKEVVEIGHYLGLGLFDIILAPKRY